jgi:hypothetical protein
MNVSLFSVLPGILPGGVGHPLSPDAFTNNYKYPVWIEDIVFDWDWAVPVRTAQTYGTPLGDAIRAKLVYRNNPLTNGFVPVNLFCRADNWVANTPQILQSGLTVHSTYTWRFPAPLWLPPNVPLTIQIQHQNDFTVAVAAPAQDVDVTFRGYLDETGVPPEFIDIPYATAFLGKVQSNVVGATTGLEPPVAEQSAQTDLFNPFTEPLNVARLQYEISISSHGNEGAGGANANFAPTDATSAEDQTSQLLAGQNYALDRRYVNFKMTSSSGRSLIRDFTPIGAVISSNNRSLDTRSVLAPGNYYVAFLQEQMPLFTDRQANAALPFQMRVGLSLVGSRRLSRAEALGTYR